MDSINTRIAKELNVQVAQVTAAVELLGDGATVPFIARYRKEKTGGLDDTQLRKLEERLGYLTELEGRRAAVLKSITEQGKLTPELERALRGADTKVDLEDLYAPFKPKRRTKAQIAREAGLEPLADALIANPTLDPSKEAEKFVAVDKGVSDGKAALEGARSILIERMTENAKLVGDLRQWLWSTGLVTSKVLKGKETEGAKFSDYFDFRQAARQIPSHRALALLRGRNEGLLGLDLDVELAPGQAHPAEAKIMTAFNIAERNRAADKWLIETAKLAWKTRLHGSLAADLLARIKEDSDTAAIGVFKTNLKDLLLAAPGGARVTMGLDPGIRTGVKVAVVDQTGKVLDTATVYPHEPRNDWNGALAAMAALSIKHKVDIIAIGNGTASRETDKLAGDLMKKMPDLKLTKVMVSEAGASVYSASEIGAQEFPNLDVSLRGAVSIARRLQDPLAELVKIEPKAIGVGQYQHDVNQTELARSLDAVVEDCVNSVGVDVNMASAPLLARVAGLNATIASNIVLHRNENGAFKRRTEIKKVARLGPKAYEQAAGFLRIANGANPLDASAVHPEAYDVVERIAKEMKRPIKAMIGDSAFLKSLDPKQFADERFGTPTVVDILAELEKPGRDPRPEFKTAEFKEGVEKIADLRPGMMLEGVVTNVTAFGAFVDVGVHQDGLVHISELADKFVKDPREVVKAGDVVKVRVKDVDVDRKRVALTMKSGAIESQSPPRDLRADVRRSSATAPSTKAPEGESALAAALRRARESGKS
ncbi:Tex family protein [Hyphomicrobium sp. ghe19]|uniref:Tex family protein n=1 Tax=Hyphomicrobium sp. ghe19 TaxID=2682968 RepID=UPI0013678AA9|nr:30S ribosomal protein S1 [Hyphomicrobium sp. ghe19]